MAIVEVKPIDKEKWHGKKGRDAFARPVTIEALVSLRTGQFATGLTVEDRERLEKATGYNLSPDHMLEKAHEFWNSPAGKIKLENKTNVFDTSNPLAEIKVKVMKASDLVANSMRDYEEGKFPSAIFVIYDEAEEMEIKASKASIRRKVVLESSKLSKSRKAEIVQIVLGISVRNQSDDYIDLKLDEAVEMDGADKVLALIQRDKARTSLHALVLEAIYKNVLRKDGPSVYYMEDLIGYDVESAVDYFQDSKNQTLKAQILEKIN
jgi:hypothetical protein